ncbi:hypothetical protein V493_07543, partial [Pseudogymnoascus sp. VKM F-4281 (FW-2241)]
VQFLTLIPTGALVSKLGNLPCPLAPGAPTGNSSNRTSSIPSVLGSFLGAGFRGIRECVEDVSPSPSVDDGAEGGKKGFTSRFAPVLTGFSAGCVGGTRGSGFSGAAAAATGTGGVAKGFEGAVVLVAPLVGGGDVTLLMRAARVQGLMKPLTVSSGGR